MLETVLLASLQYKLQREYVQLIFGCLQQLTVVGKGVSEMQERKQKVPSSLSSLIPLGQCRSLYCFLGFILCSSLGCQPRAMLSASMVGVLATAVHIAAWDRVWIPSWVGSSGCRGGLLGIPSPRSSRGSHCLAGFITSSARDLRVQSQQQEQSHIKPLWVYGEII